MQTRSRRQQHLCGWGRQKRKGSNKSLSEALPGGPGEHIRPEGITQRGSGRKSQPPAMELIFMLETPETGHKHGRRGVLEDQCSSH